MFRSYVTTVGSRRPYYSFLWFPALSDATFEQARTEIAKKPGIGRADDEGIKATIRYYLGLEMADRKFLIVDYADDIDVVCGNAGGLRMENIVDRIGDISE